MDSIFGIGTPELIVILIIAGIVMGPERIGQAARWLGRTTAQLQSISRGFVRQLNAELDQADESGDLKGAMQDVQDLRRQLAELRGEFTAAASSVAREGQKVRRQAENSIRPPTLGAGENGRKSVPATNDAADEQTAAPVELPQRIEVPDDPE